MLSLVDVCGLTDNRTRTGIGKERGTEAKMEGRKEGMKVGRKEGNKGQTKKGKK